MFFFLWHLLAECLRPEPSGEVQRGWSQAAQPADLPLWAEALLHSQLSITGGLGQAFFAAAGWAEVTALGVAC